MQKIIKIWLIIVILFSLIINIKASSPLSAPPLEIYNLFKGQEVLINGASIFINEKEVKELHFTKVLSAPTEAGIFTRFEFLGYKLALDYTRRKLLNSFCFLFNINSHEVYRVKQNENENIFINLGNYEQEALVLFKATPEGVKRQNNGERIKFSFTNEENKQNFNIVIQIPPQ